MTSSDEWWDGLCAHEIEFPSRTQVVGGSVGVGEAALWREPSAGSETSPRPVRVEAIAQGFKGSGPFRKRLWNVLLVQTSDGSAARANASELTPATTPSSETPVSG